MQNLKLNALGKTDISHLKGKNAVVHRLAVAGKGKLHSCIITFGAHRDDKSITKELLFIKALHENSDILLPHISSFRLNDYDFCYVEIFTGQVLKDDELVLHLNYHPQ